MFCLLLLLWLPVAQAQVPLQLGVARHFESIRTGESNAYLLPQSATYCEVRVMFQGTPPVQYQITFEEVPIVETSQVRLLDTERRSLPASSTVTIAKVEALAYGRSRPEARGAKTMCAYSIIVEELVWGVLPPSFAYAIAAAAPLVLVVLAVTPWVSRAVFADEPPVKRL